MFYDFLDVFGIFLDCLVDLLDVFGQVWEFHLEKVDGQFGVSFCLGKLDVLRKFGGILLYAPPGCKKNLRRISWDLL